MAANTGLGDKVRSVSLWFIHVEMCIDLSYSINLLVLRKWHHTSSSRERYELHDMCTSPVLTFQREQVRLHRGSINLLTSATAARTQLWCTCDAVSGHFYKMLSQADVIFIRHGSRINRFGNCLCLICKWDLSNSLWLHQFWLESVISAGTVYAKWWWVGEPITSAMMKNWV